MSFPVPGTLMIEPTESEPLEELDRFIIAMKTIRAEIAAVEKAKSARMITLKHAPHTAQMLMSADWAHPYSPRTNRLSGGQPASEQILGACGAH